MIVRSLSFSSFASSSEYGPHRLPISLVCRRLQRLLQLADPPGRGPRARPSSSAAPVTQTQRSATAAAGADSQPHTGYLPPMQYLRVGCLPGPPPLTYLLFQTVGLEKDAVSLTTNSPTVSPIFSPISLLFITVHLELTNLLLLNSLTLVTHQCFHMCVFHSSITSKVPCWSSTSKYSTLLLNPHNCF